MDSGQHADRQSPGILRTFVSLLVMVAFVFGLSWGNNSRQPEMHMQRRI